MPVAMSNEPLLYEMTPDAASAELSWFCPIMSQPGPLAGDWANAATASTAMQDAALPDRAQHTCMRPLFELDMFRLNAFRLKMIRLNMRTSARATARALRIATGKHYSRGAHGHAEPGRRIGRTWSKCLL